MYGIHEKLYDIYEEVARRNAGETEFHQAVYEILTSLGPVVSKHPEYAELDKRSREIVRVLCTFLRIAESLDRSHLGAVAHVQLRSSDRKTASCVSRACALVVRSVEPCEAYCADVRRDRSKAARPTPLREDILAAFSGSRRGACALGL